MSARGAHVRVSPGKSVLTVPQRYLPGGTLVPPWYMGQEPVRLAWAICCTACLWATEVADRAEAVQMMRIHAAAACDRHERAPQPGVAYRPSMWRPSEDQALRDHPDAAAAELGKLLGRSPGAVRRRRRILASGQVSPTGSRWSVEEQQTLRDCAHMTATQAAQLLGRPVASVRKCAKRLGVSLRPGLVPWTEQEQKVLLAAPTLQAAKVALPGRTKRAISVRASHLGHVFEKTAPAA